MPTVHRRRTSCPASRVRSRRPARESRSRPTRVLRPVRRRQGVRWEIRFAIPGSPALRTVRNLALDRRYTLDDRHGRPERAAGALQDDDGRGPDDSYLFRPAAQPIQPDADPGPFHELVPTSGSWQLDNGGSLGGLVSWSDLMASPADAGREVHAIAIGLGHSVDGGLTGLLRW